MNLHEVKIVSQHDLFGNYANVPEYWCSCGWRDYGITKHAIDNGVITRDGSLFYCKGHDRNICNRIFGAPGIDCEDHRR